MQNKECNFVADCPDASDEWCPAVFNFDNCQDETGDPNCHWIHESASELLHWIITNGIYDSITAHFQQFFIIFSIPQWTIPRPTRTVPTRRSAATFSSFSATGAPTTTLRTRSLWSGLPTTRTRPRRARWPTGTTSTGKRAASASSRRSTTLTATPSSTSSPWPARSGGRRRSPLDGKSVRSRYVKLRIYIVLADLTLQTLE